MNTFQTAYIEAALWSSTDNNGTPGVERMTPGTDCERTSAMITTTRLFEPSDRYQFDFKLCTYAKGWAQLDTSQDASYFGTWINPTERKIVNYCEGDVTIQTAETDEELASLVANIKEWNDQQGHRFIGIDPGYGDEMLGRLASAGLGAFVPEVAA